MKDIENDDGGFYADKPENMDKINFLFEAPANKKRKILDRHVPAESHILQMDYRFRYYFKRSVIRKQLSKAIKLLSE